MKIWDVHHSKKFWKYIQIRKLNTSKQWLLVLQNYTSNQFHGEESFRRANSHSDTQEIPRLSWSPTLHWIWGSNSGGYKEYALLGCNAIYFRGNMAFQWSLHLQGWRVSQERNQLLLAGFLLGLPSDPEDRWDILHWYIKFSLNYKVLQFKILWHAA